MGLEGGGRFDGIERRLSREDTYGRGIEPRGVNRAEDVPEREGSWLSGLGVNAETLERIRQYPAHQESSTEYLIYQLLLSKLIEGGAEWDPLKKQRVRNLIGSLRVVGLPSMTPEEQEMLREHAGAGFFASAETDINPDTIEDVKAIWSTFGLRKPDVKSLLSPVADTAQIFFPQKTSN